VLTAV